MRPTAPIGSPPVGAFLFAAGMAWPFVVQVATLLLGVVLVLRIAAPTHAAPEREATHVRRDIAEGLRWVRRNAPVRTLALVILVFNITWGAGWSVLVLYPLDHLHMGELGLGLLTGLARAHPDRPRRHLRRDFAVSGKGARHGDIWVSMSVAHSGPG